MVADKIGAMEQSNQRRNVMLDNYKIGNLITLLRKGKGLTGEKFAEALGVWRFPCGKTPQSAGVQTT